jgi:hypothetical protein
MNRIVRTAAQVFIPVAVAVTIFGAAMGAASAEAPKGPVIVQPAATTPPKPAPTDKAPVPQPSKPAGPSDIAPAPKDTVPPAGPKDLAPAPKPAGPQDQPAAQPADQHVEDQPAIAPTAQPTAQPSVVPTVESVDATTVVSHDSSDAGADSAEQNDNSGAPIALYGVGLGGLLVGGAALAVFIRSRRAHQA